MDLAELKFVVDTKDLEDAAKKIADLGTEVSKLNKPMQTLAKESAKTNKELSKAEEAAAKAALAQTKLEQAQAKSAQAASKSSSVLERQNLILEYMAQGNSKGQASILATAKAAGALDDEMLQLNKTLVTQRTLIGGDPFDKSIGLMQKLQNEYKTTTEVTNLFNKNLGLTQKQMTDLAREKERLIALYGIEGKSLNGLSAEYDQLIQKSVMINQANDARTSSMKAQIKAQNDTAKANEYMAQELERVNRLTESGGNVTSATNNKLIKFEQALKASGATAAEQVTKLEAYRQKLLSIQKAGGDRQVDYLSRALGPQITDIAVGLATGQAPLTILLQQGGQLRDQFALAGVAGADMGKMLIQASKSMVSSVKDVGVAVGQVLIGAFTGTGKAIANFAMELTNSNTILDRLKSTLLNSYGASSIFVKGISLLGTALAGVAGGIVLAAVASIGALAVAYFKASKEQDALTKQLALSGASLGLTTANAIDMAQSMNAVGVSTSAAMAVITAMAKEGGFVAKEISVVTKAAVEMQKYAGIAIEDTVKAFSKMKEKPVEALFELAKTTGMVSPEIAKMVIELIDQGKTADATAIAIKTLADVNAQQVARMKEDYTGLSLALIEVGSAIKKFFDDNFKSLFFKISPEKQLKDQIEAIDDILSGNAGAFGVGSLFADKEKYQKQREELTEQLNLIKRAKDLDASRTAENIRLNSNLEKFNKAEETFATNKDKREKEIAETTKRNQELIAAGLITQQQHEEQLAKIREKYKDKKVPKTDAEKESQRLLKESEKYLQRVSNLTNAATKEQEEYTKAQKLALDIFADPDFKNYPESQRIRIANAIEQAHTEELIANELTKQRAIQKQIYDEYVKQQDDRDKLGIAALDNSVALNKAVKEESDELLFQATLIGKTDEERKKAVKTRQAELLLAKELADIESKSNLGFGVTKEGLREEAYQRFADRTKNINAEIANDFATEMQKQYDGIKNGLTDATIAALFEGGKSGSKKLRDLIIAELKKPITVVVKAVVDVASAATGKLVNTGLNYLSNIALGGSTLGATFGAFGAGAAANIGAGAPVVSMGSATSAAFNAGGSASQMAMTAGPYVLAAVAALNALGVFRSNKTVGGGITGTLGAGDVSTYDLNRRGGTLFSGPDYSLTNMQRSPQAIALEDAFTTIRTSTAKMAETLGLSVDKVKEFTMAVGDTKVHPDIDQLGLVLDGLSDEQKIQKIDEVLTKSSDAMAEILLGAGATSQQLVQLYNNVLQERYGLETQLLELQGDTVALRARERDQLHETNRALYDQINALKDSEIAAKNAAEATKAAADLAKSNTDDAYAALERSVNAEKTRLDSEISAVRIRENLTRESIASINNLFEILDDNIKSLYSEVNSTSNMQFNAARGLITQSLATARSTGYLPDGDQLSDAIGTVRTQLEKNQYKSKVDAERDRLLLALELQALQEITDTQLSIEEKMLKGIEDQLKSLNDQKLTLDDLLINAKDQLQASRDINTSVINLQDAIARLATAISAEAASRAQAAIVSSASQQASSATAYAISSGSTYNASSATPVSSREQEIAAIYNTVLGRSADVTGLENWVKSGMSSDEIKNAIASSAEAQARAISVEAQNQWIQQVTKEMGISTDIVARANGGYTPAGMTLVGEQGPELVNFNRPGMVYTAAQSAALMGGSSEELAAIRQELIMLRAETRAVVNNTSKAAKILDRSSPDGQSLQVTVLAA